MGEPTFKIDINPEAIQQRVTEAIIDSAIGEKIKLAVQKAMVEKRSFNSNTVVEEAIESVIYEEVKRITRETVRNELQEQIKAAVLAKMDAEKIEDISSAIVGRYTGDLWSTED